MSCWTSLPSSVFKLPSDFKSNILDVSSKYKHACAFNTSYEFVCWGEDYFGETIIPRKLGNVNSVTAGMCITCIMVRKVHKLECWGIYKFQFNNRELIFKQIVLTYDYIFVLNEDGS